MSKSFCNGSSGRVSLYITWEMQELINKYGVKRAGEIFGERSNVSFAKYVHYLIMQDIANHIDETDMTSLTEDQKRLLK